jgi:hypothetical protein
MVTVTAVEGFEVPSITNVVGERLQLAPDGIEHVKVRVWLNPF